jgi:uncharacterized protein (DUF302 family)
MILELHLLSRVNNMKKLCRLSVLTVAAILLAFGCAPRGPMFKTFSSPYSFDETVSRVTTAAKAAGWKVPAVGRIDESLARAGKQIRPVAIVNLCNPEHAERLLKGDQWRAASAIMPCRVSVYETSAGVMLAMLHPDFLMRSLSGEIKEVIGHAAAENSAIVEEAVSYPGK